MVAISSVSPGLCWAPLCSLSAPSNGPQDPAGSGSSSGSPSGTGASSRDPARVRGTRPVARGARQRVVSGAGLACRHELRHIQRDQPDRDVLTRHLRRAAHRQRAGGDAGYSGSTRSGCFLHDLLWAQDRAGFQKQAGPIRRNCGAPRHQAAVRLLRFVLGSAPTGRGAAGTDAGRAQLGLGTESRERSASTTPDTGRCCGTTWSG